LGGTPEVRLGSLDPIRDLNFVKDIVQGFIAVAEHDEALGRVTNLGTGKGITMGDLATRILRVTNVDKPVVHDLQRDRPAESEVFRLIADNSKACELGWTPQYGLDQGLKATVEFVAAHPGFFRLGHYAT
jgi:nucleoside-diphosphate-sugar epimerase